jgi:MerR family transcriptional regulator, mercuric resistance operon regulatory protein
MLPFKDTCGEPFSIGELSRLTGVHIETIRYYDKVKILPRSGTHRRRSARL